MNFTEDDLFRLALDDPRYIIESGFTVINKEREAVPFIFNNLQNDFYEVRTYRDDIVKASQIGYSTEIDAILTVKFLLVPNSWSVIIAHEAEATKKLKEKVDYFLQTLPDWLRRYYKPRIDSSTETHNEVMNSKLFIGTAGSIAFARGTTPHFVHMSEVAWWRDDGRTETGLLRAVPANDHSTWIVKESTANGEGSHHHKEWKREKAGQSEFSPYFAPWFKYEGYTIPGGKIEDRYDSEEQRLLKKFPEYINEERLSWRRLMIRTMTSNKGRTPEEMFKQEFPADDKEAFLFSGNPFFPALAIQTYDEQVKPPIATGNLYGVDPDIQFEETDKGYLKLWDFPDINSQYVIGADIGKDHDFCSAHIIDKKTQKMIGHFHARISPYQFGTELDKLGRFFNKAKIIPEANNQGISTIDRLVALEYPNLYRRKKKDKIKKIEVEEWGWWTSSKTKPRILDYLHDLVRTIDVEIPDADTIDEMRTYSRLEDGSMGASAGNFDDRVISCCLAYYGVKLFPYRSKKVKLKKAVTPAKRFKTFRSAHRNIRTWRGR